jgi:hypothetical protein
MKTALIGMAVESLNLSGRLSLKVTGTSMLPAILPGSYATIIAADPAHVEPGRIVLVRSDSGLRLHRLVRRCVSAEGAFLVTRGDNNEDEDPGVSSGNLLGVLAGIEQPSLVKRCIFRFRNWLNAPLKIWSPHLSR